ncbi:hypothetical protein AC249_AIPGENE3026 [Exaiptasia diaphana]|nr:hypothetical protein AC249_AIPGENE3026 [Exaiptasia diaphana]
MSGPSTMDNVAVNIDMKQQEEDGVVDPFNNNSAFESMLSQERYPRTGMVLDSKPKDLKDMTSQELWDVVHQALKDADIPIKDDDDDDGNCVKIEEIDPPIPFMLWQGQNVAFPLPDDHVLQLLPRERAIYKIALEQFRQKHKELKKKLPPSWGPSKKLLLDTMKWTPDPIKNLQDDT